MSRCRFPICLLLGVLLCLGVARADVACTTFPCSALNLNQALPVIGTFEFKFIISDVNPLIPTSSAISLSTDISHPYTGDLILTLTSPAGTEITLAYRRGSLRANVFAGTTWTDSAPHNTASYKYDTFGLPATPLRPEIGSFADFLGENPNGVWTFKVEDVEIQDAGVLNSLVLHMTDVGSGCAGEFYLKATFPNTPRNTVAIGTCEPPYTGTCTRKCNSNGLWATNFITHCTRITCPAEPDTGNASWNQINAPAILVGTCKPGFVGKPLRECGADGVWGPVNNPCEVPSPVCGEEHFGRATWPETNRGEWAIGLCDPGFVGTSERLCQLDGTWAPSILYHCKRQETK